MIVVFSHAHPSISKGGAEVSAYTLFKGLRQRGLAATFVAMCPADQLGKVRFETTDELTLPYQPVNYDHFFHFADPAVAVQAIEAVTPLRPTMLVFHHFLFLGINSLRAIVEHFAVPSALVLHEFLAICHHHGQMVTRPAKRLCNQSSPTRCNSCFPEFSPEELHLRKQYFLDTMLGLDRLVSPSHFLKDRFAHWGVPAEKIAVIENGLAAFEPVQRQTEEPPQPGRIEIRSPFRKSTKQAPRPRSRKTVFGYFGQINPFKGIDQILDALDILHSQTDTDDLTRIVVRIHGNIVGVTEDFKNRFETACQSGLVEYAGPYVNADVHTLMEQCDYILMASKWWENSPVVIQEAYAAGRPVIAPAIGGMAEKVIDRVSGRHFKPNNPGDLANLMVDCCRTDAAYSVPCPTTARQMADAYISAIDNDDRTRTKGTENYV